MFVCSFLNSSLVSTIYLYIPTAWSLPHNHTLYAWLSTLSCMTFNKAVKFTKLFDIVAQEWREAQQQLPWHSCICSAHQRAAIWPDAAGLLSSSRYRRMIMHAEVEDIKSVSVCACICIEVCVCAIMNIVKTAVLHEIVQAYPGSSHRT